MGASISSASIPDGVPLPGAPRILAKVAPPPFNPQGSLKTSPCAKNISARKCSHKSPVTVSRACKAQRKEGQDRSKFKRKSKSRSRSSRRRRPVQIQPSGFAGALDAGDERVFAGESSSLESVSSPPQICDFSECLVGTYCR